DALPISAYSGSTAITASRAIASGPEMSFWAASAAQASRKAAATTEAPNTATSAIGARRMPAMRKTTAGAASTRQSRTRRTSAVGHTVVLVLGKRTGGGRGRDGEADRRAGFPAATICGLSATSVERKADLPTAGVSTENQVLEASNIQVMRVFMLVRTGARRPDAEAILLPRGVVDHRFVGP